MNRSLKRSTDTRQNTNLRRSNALPPIRQPNSIKINVQRRKKLCQSLTQSMILKLNDKTQNDMIEKEVNEFLQRENLTEKLNNMLKLCNDLSSGELRTVMLLNGKNYIDQCLNESQINIKYNIKIKPHLSVIIPAFNCEKTINIAINSVQNQNFTDYEIILINDFSKDNTSDIINIKKKKTRE